MIGDGHRKEPSIGVNSNGFWRNFQSLANMQQAEPSNFLPKVLIYNR
jgi:hypothetical protein